MHVVQANIENAAKIVAEFLNKKDISDTNMSQDDKFIKTQQQHKMYLLAKIQNKIQQTLSDFDKKAISGIPSNKSVAWLFNR